MPDHRVTPYRPDLAAASLRGIIDRPRYADGMPLRASRGAVAMTNRPDAAAPKVSELLYGERFVAYEREGAWAWGQNQTDDYVGYVPAVGLVEDDAPATHRIAALRAFVFPEPNLKTPPQDVLGLGAQVAVGERIADYAQLVTGGWVATAVLAPLTAADADPVAVAELLLNVPYLWGGRTPIGLDCSGLVQLALSEAGLEAPRDSDLQEQALGSPLPATSIGEGGSFDEARSVVRRGDLVFFPGHVGIMADDRRLIHANATAMAVTCDPLAEVAERIRQVEGIGITSVRRLGGGDVNPAETPTP